MMSDVVAVPVDDGSPSRTTNSASTSKEFRERTIRSLKRGLGRLWRRHRGNASITEYDPSYKVAYLGNVLTGWAKGEGCVEKPVATLWRNYVGSSRPDVSMRLTVTCGGLTATTRDHGLTEYWAHRVTYCTAPTSHPRLVVWVYRHEGRRLRPELRCHAALCSTESTARRLSATLNARLQQALMEFRRDKVSRQNARLSLANSVYENPSLPRRKILLSTGGQNYRPPLERSKSAPKLSAIEEDAAAEELEQARLLEELRSLRNVSCSWPDQDDWRLARLVECLDRGNSGEFSDENGSISSGCETASTANSEERTPGLEDSSNNSDCAEPARSPRRVYFSDEALHDGQGIASVRRNSDGSANFMTCTGSPKFLRCNMNRKMFTIHGETDNNFSDNPPHNAMFDFEDAEDFAEEDVVDCSPRGEHPRSERRLKRADTFPPPMGKANLLDDDEFSTLDALDEEPDSDESGYVEAPPKALLSHDDSKDVTDGRMSSGNFTADIQREKGIGVEGSDDKQQLRSMNQRITKDCGSVKSSILHEELKNSVCPISETIKKLANASLKTSKSLEISTNNCLQKALSNLKPSKSFDNSKTIDVDQDTVESPSLHQRKLLLAQQGVTV